MIDYVNSRLVVWSEWIVRREDEGLGFPKECCYTRLVARSGGAGYQPDFTSDAQEIDSIMTKFKNHDADKFRALHLFYGVEFKQGKTITVSMNQKQIAADLGRHRETVSNWLDEGHRFILDGLLESDAIAHVR